MWWQEQCTCELENKTASTDQPKVEKQFIGMAILLSEPHISPADLAKRVGVSRGTLYTKNKNSSDVAQTPRARDTGRIPKGTKDADGNLEAEFPTEADEWSGDSPLGAPHPFFVILDPPKAVLGRRERLASNYVKTKRTNPDDLWLVVGHLLRDLALGRWRQALVWARSFVAQLGRKVNPKRVTN